MKHFFRYQINYEILSSYLLCLGVILAFIISNNNFLLSYYRALINVHFSIGVGEYILSKPLLKWVNDGLMALFFFLLSLEMKYQISEGEFKEARNLILPSVAAIGGFIIPAILYILVNYNYEEGQIGWAIPVATDTAFVLAIVAFLGSKVSNGAKVFLIGLSIIDDVLAVSTLAIFYTPNLDVIQLYLCSIPICGLFILNHFKVSYKWLYYCCGISLWLFTVKSGVHGTIAGIISAFFIPNQITISEQKLSMVKELTNSLHSTVAFFILPLFAFVNCELPLNELSIKDIVSPISLGCFIGLLVGKPLGIYLFSMAAIKLDLTTLPEKTDTMMFVGLSCLCGIGFTLSLFIGLQAFELVIFENQMKVGVIIGSCISAFIGFLICKYSKNTI
jgi:NhaA family Na+:H+ antiporter